MMMKDENEKRKHRKKEKNIKSHYEIYGEKRTIEKDRDKMKKYL